MSHPWKRRQLQRGNEPSKSHYPPPPAEKPLRAEAAEPHAKPSHPLPTSSDVDNSPEKPKLEKEKEKEKEERERGRERKSEKESERERKREKEREREKERGGEASERRSKKSLKNR
jgi:hypothetical protein